MHCPYCGDKRTDVFKVIHRRTRTYRYRRCIFCKARENCCFDCPEGWGG